MFAAWKIIAEEVKHANASYMPAVTSAVLDKRIPFHDDMVLTKWYSESKGKERKAAPNEQKAGKRREGRKEGGRIERRKRERAGIEEKKGEQGLW